MGEKSRFTGRFSPSLPSLLFSLSLSLSPCSFWALAFSELTWVYVRAFADRVFVTNRARRQHNLPRLHPPHNVMPAQDDAPFEQGVYPRPALLPPHGQINHSISSVYLLPWTSAGSTLNASPTKLKLIVRLFGHRTLPPHPPPTLSLSLSLAGDAFGAGGRDDPPVGMRRQDLAAARCAH